MAGVKKFLFVQRSAPHGSIYAQEALDVLLISSAFEQRLAVLFMDDGVYQLLTDMRPQSIHSKNFTQAFRALADHDVHDVYVSAPCLAARGLTLADLLIPATPLSHPEITTLLEQHDVVLGLS